MVHRIRGVFLSKKKKKENNWNLSTAHRQMHFFSSPVEHLSKNFREGRGKHQEEKTNRRSGKEKFG